MSASISDPFLLSSYALSARHSRHASSSSSQQLAHVLATHKHGSGSDKTDGMVTIAVQGDGVHVLDVSSQDVLQWWHKRHRKVR